MQGGGGCCPKIWGNMAVATTSNRKYVNMCGLIKNISGSHPLKSSDKKKKKNHKPTTPSHTQNTLNFHFVSLVVNFWKICQLASRDHKKIKSIPNSGESCNKCDLSLPGTVVKCPPWLSPAAETSWTWCSTRTNPPPTKASAPSTAPTTPRTVSKQSDLAKKNKNRKQKLAPVTRTMCDEAGAAQSLLLRSGRPAVAAESEARGGRRWVTVKWSCLVKETNHQRACLLGPFHLPLSVRERCTLNTLRSLCCLPVWPKWIYNCSDRRGQASATWWMLQT